MDSSIKPASKSYFMSDIRLEQEEQPSIVLLVRKLLQRYIQLVTNYPFLAPELASFVEELEGIVK